MSCFSNPFCGKINLWQIDIGLLSDYSDLELSLRDPPSLRSTTSVRSFVRCRVPLLLQWVTKVTVCCNRNPIIRSWKNNKMSSARWYLLTRFVRTSSLEKWFFWCYRRGRILSSHSSPLANQGEGKIIAMIQIYFQVTRGTQWFFLRPCLEHIFIRYSLPDSTDLLQD